MIYQIKSLVTRLLFRISNNTLELTWPAGVFAASWESVWPLGRCSWRNQSLPGRVESQPDPSVLPNEELIDMFFASVPCAELLKAQQNYLTGVGRMVYDTFLTCLPETSSRAKIVSDGT